MDGAVTEVPARPHREGPYALAASVVVTVLLFVVPYGDVVGRPLVWLSTLAHELGHGFTALAVGGSFAKLELYPSAAGMAWTSSAGGWRSAAVAAGGLIGPAVLGALCFASSRTARGARRMLFLLGGIALFSAGVWVRNIFGFTFVAVLGVVLMGIAWRLSDRVARFVLLFLGVQLSLSVFARSDYLFVSHAEMDAGVVASDVAKIAEVLWLPYWFWGGVCGLFSVVVLLMGLRIAFLPGGD